MSSTRDATEPRARSFDVVTAVWGKDYRQLFLDVCVPNQLTPGNLGALPAGSRYRVFTSKDDAEVLRSSRALRQVNELMLVDVVVVRELSALSRNKFTRIRICHRRAIADARESCAALIFLCPDHFMSEGALAAVLRRHEAGSRAVVCSGIRVERAAFLDALHARGGVRGVAPRDLVSLALDHLHPAERSQMVDRDRNALEPAGVFWTVPGEGILARYFRLHPVMVDPLRPEALLEGTIDGHYVRRSCPLRDQVHVVSDSDELSLFEMSNVDALVIGTGPGRRLVWRAATMMSRCDAHQQWYWTRPIRLHVRDVGSAWSSVERDSARFADQVTRLWAARRWLTFRYLKVRWGRAAKTFSTRQLRRSAVRLTNSAARAVKQLRLRKRSARVVRRARRRARRSVALLTR